MLLRTAILGSVLLLAACAPVDSGRMTLRDSGGNVAPAPEQSVEAEPVELLGSESIPTLNIVLHKDVLNGWNLEIVTTNFTFAPEHASEAYLEGEGHVHLSIDDVFTARVYGPWHHIRELPPGTHILKISLHSSTHAPYVYEGRAIEDTEIVDSSTHSTSSGSP